MNSYTLRSKNGKLETDVNGFKSLLAYYNFARQYQNCTITLVFDALNFFEANLSAFLMALIFKLEKTRNVKTYVDFTCLREGLNILIRNGFTTYLAKKQFEFQPMDNRDSTVPLGMFATDDPDGFVEYIERRLIHQRGLYHVAFNDKEKVKNSYFEIFDNVGIHAETSAPVFVCGQYFPIQEELKFTLVDLGVGFLKKIREFTKDRDPITSAERAISWAINGGSTKSDARGGNGLKKIFFYCRSSGGTMHIVTDGCYWVFNGTNIQNEKIEQPVSGTTIHLVFKYLRK
jgi:hypothetical protein